MNPELQSKIEIWRRKCAEGTITLDEMREAILAVRQSRLSAAESARKSTRSAKPTRTAEDMLGDLGL